MSLPREPRQKMINMMYLVLTALLALNVSAEILNAFKTVNKSLETSNTTVANSTEQIMTSLKDLKDDPKTKEKAEIWLPKAQQVEQLSKDVYSYIQGLKNDIITKGGGNVDANNFKADNLEIATRMMVDQKKGIELKRRLEEFKTKVLNDVDPEIKKLFTDKLPINTDVPKGVSKANNTFERAYFHMVPTVAALTVLSKFQNDIKTSENKIVEFCHNQVGAIKVRFNKYVAFAATDKSYVMPGEQMQITAGIGAFSDQALPTITIDGSNEPLTGDGVALRKIPASAGIGKHTIMINVKYVDLDGNLKSIDKPIEYMVGQSTASIALDKMNVLYIGVDNPVTVAASGAGDDKIKFSITGGGGTWKKQPGSGKYSVSVNSVTDDCWIEVTVDGKLAGRSQFRVRTVPEAQAYVGGQPSGSEVAAGAFKAQVGVQAGIKNFPFTLDYNVMSYKFTCDDDNGDVITIPAQGARFDGQVAKAIQQNVKAGRMVTIEDIRVKNPDGRVVLVPSIFYYIK